MVVLGVASGVLAGTNLPARVANITNAPAAVRKPMLLVQPVAGDLALVARMAPAGAVTRDGAVDVLAPAGSVARDVAVGALGGAFKAQDAAAVTGFGQVDKEEGAAVVTGLGRAVAGTNGLVVAGLVPAGRVMAEFVREIHGQQGVENDAAFLADVDVWRGGPLGEIVTRAIRARQAGDMATYSNLVSRYWREYNVAVQRRVALGKARK
jgi:hypothetical protein